MIAKFYCWDVIAQSYVLTLTAIVGTSAYNNGISKLVLKYERGYVKCNDKTIFRWKWSA